MTPPDRIYTAALVIIGDEILSGRTQDANLAYLAKWLNVQGIRLREARVVPDIEAEIVEAVNACRARHDYVFTTGGIGPTHDDITIDAIAKAFGVPVIVHPEAEAMLRAYYGDALTDARLRMARVPEGAELVPNALSAAPGIRIKNVYILAGVPGVARAMLHALDGRLEGGRPVLSRTIGAKVGESTVADLLAATEAAHPGVQVGSYPFWRGGEPNANFVIRSTDPQAMNLAAEAILKGLAEMGLDPVDGEI
ncbi:competence/damage-inducible protein A [Pedomonas mirosovicensis]|uniref:competence/damage-inducible protein A n=1 Tax=Pedomonas mirosovicensis TaxID=2908641 RepID=UPI0021689A10|nr:competence/damage-inducible protein A [Pedomonas mirosovicensis]MCH8685804.1 competence/damage-inducible protein A [Pedomonas mirosovicensis]